jgi:putative hemolysin
MPMLALPLPSVADGADPAGSTSQPPLRLDVRWADCEDDVRAAQRLRYRVFALEMGAHLPATAASRAGIDCDRFDAYCDHLLVRLALPGQSLARQPVIGTYRVLTPAGALRAGGTYTESEFDLAPLAALRPRTAELGRSCVDAPWRSGAVIMLLWAALGRYMRERQLNTLIGCASVTLADEGDTARRVWSALCQSHLADARWRVRPRVPWPVGAAGSAEDLTAQAAAVPMPPLVKGYLRCGARLLGPPAYDAAFNTADLPLMLRTGDVTPRYRRHFLGD